MGNGAYVIRNGQESVTQPAVENNGRFHRRLNAVDFDSLDFVVLDDVTISNSFDEDSIGSDKSKPDSIVSNVSNSSSIQSPRGKNRS